MLSEARKYVPPMEKKSPSPAEKNVVEKSPAFNFEMLTDPEQRRLLGEATEELIDHVVAVETQEVAATVPRDTTKRPPPTKRVVVFLDKSARPLSTLFREMWKMKRPDERVPQILFMNIGQEKNGNDENDGKNSVPEIMAEEVNRFTALHKLPEGSTVTVVDELIDWGGTKRSTEKILKQFFPNTVCDFYYLAQVVSDDLNEIPDIDAPDVDPKLKRLFRHQYIFRDIAPWTYSENKFSINRGIKGIAGVVDPPDERSLLAARYLGEDERDKQRLEEEALHVMRELNNPEFAQEIKKVRNFLSEAGEVGHVRAAFNKDLETSPGLRDGQRQELVVQAITILMKEHIEPLLKKFDQRFEQEEKFYNGSLTKKDLGRERIVEYDLDSRRLAERWPGFGAEKIYEFFDDTSHGGHVRLGRYNWLGYVKAKLIEVFRSNKDFITKNEIDDVVGAFDRFMKPLFVKINELAEKRSEINELISSQGSDDGGEGARMDHSKFSELALLASYRQPMLQLREELKQVAQEYWKNKTEKI